MDRIRLGFLVAGLYNLGVVGVSRGFSDVLGAIDPLFSPGGCVGVVLWGLAYMALAGRYRQAPLVAAVFCLEKAFYAGHWALWIAAHGGELAGMRTADPLTAAFFSSYGLGDAVFMVFFGYVAWRERANLFGALDPG